MLLNYSSIDWTSGCLKTKIESIIGLDTKVQFFVGDTFLFVYFAFDVATKKKKIDARFKCKKVPNFRLAKYNSAYE